MTAFTSAGPGPAPAAPRHLRPDARPPRPSSRDIGAAAWLDRQLAPATIDDSACDALLARFPLIGLDISGIRAKAKAGALKFGA